MPEKRSLLKEYMTTPMERYTASNHMPCRIMELDWGLGSWGVLGLRSRMVTIAGAVLQRLSFFFLGGCCCSDWISWAAASRARVVVVTSLKDLEDGRRKSAMGWEVVVRNGSSSMAENKRRKENIKKKRWDWSVDVFTVLTEFENGFKFHYCIVCLITTQPPNTVISWRWGAMPRHAWGFWLFQASHMRALHFYFFLYYFRGKAMKEIQT